MTAEYVKAMRAYRITVTCKEAETLAFNSAVYFDLLKAVTRLKGADTVSFYGSKYAAESVLKR